MLLAFILTLSGGLLLGILLGARFQRGRSQPSLNEAWAWARRERAARLASETRVRQLERDVQEFEKVVAALAPPEPEHGHLVAELESSLRVLGLDVAIDDLQPTLPDASESKERIRRRLFGGEVNP
ncbi:hypothetical protein SAMN02745121_08725 [Nannocystis exedens]|uniref:Uncharacterized protein n=2 Tax=Nannocystis exedens TaxID=54 RepID=A0A1I2IKV8_9BACT|nr:hypothetical protein NAEX_06209 [Nannocystis exedens]SFF41677.1 hypothetical protein SAMN02745121_08725 [Nannocystis exedens]